MARRKYIICLAVAALYFITGFGFSYIYYNLPYNSFYAPNIKFEADVVEDTRKLGELLKRILVREADSNLATKFAIRDPELGKRLEIRELFGMNGTTITFQLLIYNDRNSPYAPPALNTLTLTLLNESYFGTVHPQIPSNASSLDETVKNHYVLSYSGNEPITTTTFSVDSGNFKRLNFLEIFSRSYVKSGPSDRIALLDVSDGESGKINDFIVGTSGDPSRIINAPLRYIYFSFIVLTTTGLGDIIPLTTLARSLVAIEIILGIVISGIFITIVTRSE